MNSYKAAISKLNNNPLKIGSEIVSIKDALNRISSKEVIAKSDYPADDNTAFDGFAVNSKETKNLLIQLFQLRILSFFQVNKMQNI